MTDKKLQSCNKLINFSSESNIHNTKIYTNLFTLMGDSLSPLIKIRFVRPFVRSSIDTASHPNSHTSATFGFVHDAYN